MSVDGEVRSNDRDTIHSKLTGWEGQGHSAQETEVGGEPGNLEMWRPREACVSSRKEGSQW